MAAEIKARLSLDSSQFTAGMNSATSALSSFIPAIGGALSVAGLVEFGRRAIETGARVAHMAEMFGLSTGTIQRLNYAAGQTDVSVEMLTASMARLMKAAAGGELGKLEAFSRLGMTLGEIRRSSPEDLLLGVAEGFRRASESGERNQAVADIFELLGKRAFELIPLLSQGRAGLEGMFAKAPVMADEMIRKLDAAEKKLKTLRDSATVTGVELGDVFLTFFRKAAFQGDVAFQMNKAFITNLPKGYNAALDASMAVLEKMRQENKRLFGPPEAPAAEAAKPVALDAEDITAIASIGNELKTLFSDISRIGQEPQERVAELTAEFDRLRDRMAGMKSDTLEYVNTEKQLLAVYKERAALLVQLADKDDRDRLKAVRELASLEEVRFRNQLKALDAQAQVTALTQREKDFRAGAAAAGGEVTEEGRALLQQAERVRGEIIDLMQRDDRKGGATARPIEVDQFARIGLFSGNAASNAITEASRKTAIYTQRTWEALNNGIKIIGSVPAVAG